MQISQLKLTSKCPTLRATISAVCRQALPALAVGFHVPLTWQSGERVWIVCSLFTGRFAACGRETQNKGYGLLPEILPWKGAEGPLA